MQDSQQKILCLPVSPPPDEATPHSLDAPGEVLSQITPVWNRFLQSLYYPAAQPYASSMLMIAAAMDEELEIARLLCRDTERISCEKVKLWQGTRREQPICFLKSGIGPKRSAAGLQEALRVIKPSGILLIGYAGALAPDLKLGDLVAVRKALAFSLDEIQPDWEHVRVDDEFELSDHQSLMGSALSAGLNACSGNTMTSSYVLGDPVHKRLLHDRFGASIVDMETAAIAGVARSAGIPLSCIRVISDVAQDSFLAPFAYDPSAGIPARAKKLMETGMVGTYREWKNHTAVAKESLGRFLALYL